MAQQEIRQWTVKHRPNSFETFVGNKDTVSAAKSIIKNRSAHAILISGPSGCGKTTLAKIIAAELNGLDGSSNRQVPYITEINVGAEGGKDSINSIVASSRFLPTQEGKVRVIILEEVHALTKQAINSLLRPIEEPPHKDLVWILVTDRPWVLDVTLLDRCRKLPVNLPNKQELASYVLKVMKHEKALSSLSVEDRNTAALRIAKYANFVPRAAVQLLADVEGAGLKDFEDFKKFISTSNKSVDNSLDKSVSIIMGALFSDADKESRLAKLIGGYNPPDCIGLVSRLMWQLHEMLQTAVTGKFNYAIRNSIEAIKQNSKKLPSIERMTKVLGKLARMRLALKEMPMDPSLIVMPVLLELIIEDN
jgi:DNA polymerase III subunit gamma/tau